VDTRHFELQDLLSEALIALEAGDRPAVEAALRKALRWVESDWLATPGQLYRAPHPPQAPVTEERNENDDEE
jgi:hypothetical protein